MRDIGLCDVVNTEIGNIIVMGVYAQCLAHLPDLDRKALSKLITKAKH
ncbi:MAG TPA: hypothetical protein QGI62_03155 [Anaerolineales bacterium]|jgi:hypothetical protein|nr:hypothetical protein [Anaerolineales bacterium]|tara:strand:+ start:1347 stop:1490 length:144 start_codon:yes stop_codon:yes gene_type:complete